jgi:hypothetical protein
VRRRDMEYGIALTVSKNKNKGNIAKKIRKKRRRETVVVRGKKHFMYGLVDKTYIGEPTTTSSLQS